MQARQAGREIRNIIGDESLRFFYLPYLRAKQTLEEIIREGFADHPADCVLAREEVLFERARLWKSARPRENAEVQGRAC